MGNSLENDMFRKKIHVRNLGKSLSEFSRASNKIGKTIAADGSPVTKTIGEMNYCKGSIAQDVGQNSCAFDELVI